MGRSVQFVIRKRRTIIKTSVDVGKLDSKYGRVIYQVGGRVPRTLNGQLRIFHLISQRSVCARARAARPGKCMYATARLLADTRNCEQVGRLYGT